MLWAVLNIMDKFFLTKWIKNAISYQILLLLFDSIVIIPFILFTKISFAYPWFILGIVSNVIISLAFIYYNKAMMMEEASRVVIMFYVNPLFVLLFAYVFLGEIFNLSKYIGIFLLVLSAILISYKKTKGKFKMSAVLGYVLIIAISWALFEVFAKYAFNYIDYFSFTFWNVIGGVITGLSLLCFTGYRKNFLREMSKINKGRAIFWRIVTVALYYTAIIAFYTAISNEPVSLVAAIPSTQPLFVFIYTLILSSFIPRVLHEKYDRKTIALKFLSVVLVFVGSWLIVS